MQRVREPEWMDEKDIDRAALADSLKFIRFVNRRLGGVAPVLRLLKRWTRDIPRDHPVTMLDIATGSADIPVAAVKWARGNGIDLHVTAIDTHPTTLDLAREYVERSGCADAITLLEMDALKLTDHFEPNSFDLVHAGLFLHHLDELPALTVLRMMDRLSKCGLIWNDLLRSRLSLLGARLLTIGQPEIVKHDACVSVRAAFTPAEAGDMARRVDLENVHIRALPHLGRFVLSARPQ